MKKKVKNKNLRLQILAQPGITWMTGKNFNEYFADNCRETAIKRFEISLKWEKSSQYFSPKINILQLLKMKNIMFEKIEHSGKTKNSAFGGKI